MRETAYTDPFWEALVDGKVLIHRCEECTSRFFPPGPVCPYCQSLAVEWQESTGKGTLFSFTRQHVTAPEFDDGLIVGVIELDDEPRLLTPIDEPYQDLRIGNRFRIESFEYVSGFDRGRLEDYPFFVANRIDG
ncbi:Zn-ribbon domain-containing OB-fold protein [Halegenticoccus tardaugens]|uniref:Zn-ribbon domain-containing OB-fold protein n=1 Tax=Halegenticoccus tardaugens TaxID=2071624 RepID=UPI00100A46A5